MEENFDIVSKSLDDWNAQLRRLEYLNERHKILKDELDKIGEESLSIQKNKYKYTDIIIENHKYFTNNDKSILVKVIGVDHNCYGYEFIKSEKGNKDRTYFSSSLGILYNGDIPISEKEYNEIYSNY